MVQNIITIDGPSGSGKGTVCQLLATKLGWHLLDSGALYRIIAYLAFEKNISLEDIDTLTDLALHLDVRFISNGSGVDALFNGVNISDKLRTEKVASAASQIAILQPVRDALLARQKEFAKSPGLIADGRDMGTVVFPDAPVKIFLDATAKERAQRRFKQLQVKGFDVKIANILSEIKARDHRDRHRTVAPLVPATNALVIDSTALSIGEVVNQVLDFARLKIEV
ncbi:MAG: (d)CMP kinase [Psychromonas sp.]|nr:(d)CMP kinase [Psychromonas sp.]